MSFWHPNRLPMSLIGADDTPKSVASTSETEVKYMRFNQPSNIPFAEMKINVSIYVSGGTGYAYIYIDDETSPRLTLTTTSTSEEVKTGTIAIDDLPAGIHTVKLKLKNDTSGQTTYTELWEVYVK